MIKTIDLLQDGGGHDYPQTTRVSPFDQTQLRRQRVDAHYLIMDGEEVVARASLWWRDVPNLEGERLGVIGHFAAYDQFAAVSVLAQSLTRLRDQHCTLAVGPMDGNTWRSYRFVTEQGSAPPFFLEPGNPPEYPGYFLAAGFTPLAGYSSAWVTDLTTVDDRITRAKARLHNAGVAWRPLDINRFDEELRSIYRLSIRSFTDNFLYTPIDEAEFLEQYRPIAPHLQPELTLMAEFDGELLGYLFGIPDLNQAGRGETIDTFVLKTVAVLPARHAAGLGSVLVAESHRIASELGYGKAIHALMFDGNSSRNISGHYTQAERRYALYQQRLESPR